MVLLPLSISNFLLLFKLHQLGVTFQITKVRHQFEMNYENYLKVIFNSSNDLVGWHAGAWSDIKQ